MKNITLIILLICFISCKMDNSKSSNKEKNTEKSIDTIFVDEKGDTIKPQTAYLKKNYKLIIFPALDKNKKVINFRLINDKKDKTYLLAETFIANYRLYYEGIDFQNYFALHSNGGGTSKSYFWLYDKETGNEVLTGIKGDFDLKNELILYTDENNEYKNFIYDVKTKAKTWVDIPKSFTDKQKCTHNDYFEKSSYIKRVTNEYYFVAFKDCPSSIEFKVKKLK
ncbi:hypothetical protein EV144_106234 [Flavobacterium sp. 270]|uniref:hypothetical protein n=1 Tax=Flavobacterium sp. 270 TaxID=2512114 RepID=UPI0010652A4E|nr:hypothetical protein [Flavobacterium sp. 270]TDW46562.1 hypothetical protein EV144_106234 [Flavobacterium sp. 270]